VMDEAVRCDRLLLMRAGTMLADDTLDGVLAATGTQDVEHAFLTLVDRAEGRLPADGVAASPHDARHGRHLAGERPPRGPDGQRGAVDTPRHQLPPEEVTR